jgi:hypothetical protein
MITKILRPFLSACWAWKNYLNEEEPKWIYYDAINGGFIAFDYVQKSDIDLVTRICRSIIHD